MTNHKESLLDVLKTLYCWKIPILVTSVIAALIAVFYSLSVPNYYKSKTVFYPANPRIASRGALFGGADENMSFFGGTKETDRILNIAKSSELVNYIVKKYDLYAHYEIDTTELEAPHYVTNDFMKLYKVKKNVESAIEISIEDVDREKTADMVWAIVGKINEINNRLTKDNQRRILGSFEKRMVDKQADFTTSTDSLRRLRAEYGIVSVASQEEFLTTLVAETESSLAAKRTRLNGLQNSGTARRDTINALKANIKSLEGQLFALISPESDSKINLHKFNSGREKVMQLELRQEDLAAEISFLRDRFFQYQTVYDTDVYSLYITEPPSTPVVRSRPRRTLTVLSVGMIAFILSCLGVLLLDYYKDTNWKEIVRQER